MDANAHRVSRARTLAVALVVVVLVAVVAIASGGSTPRGAIGEHRPSEGLLNAVLSLFVVGMGVATVLVALMVSFFGRYTPDGPVRKRRSPVQSVITFVVAMALLVVVVRALGGSRGQRLRSALQPRGDEATGASEAGHGRYQPEFVLWPVLVVGGLVLVVLLAWYLVARGRRSALEPGPQTPEEALADVLAETLDDLRSERDARRAVIAAYARMERALAASGLPRGQAEAPEEYLERILGEVAVSRRSAGRLTALFAWARFSGHDVRPEMKEEAIETLEQVQRELAAEDAARIAASSGRAA